MQLQLERKWLFSYIGIPEKIEQNGTSPKYE